MGPFFTNTKKSKAKNSTYNRINDDDQDARTYNTDTTSATLSQRPVNTTDARYQPEMTRAMTRAIDAEDPFASPNDPPTLLFGSSSSNSKLQSVSEETPPDVQGNRHQVTNTRFHSPSVQLTSTTTSAVSTNSRNARSFMVEGSDNRFLYNDGSEGDLRDHWCREGLIAKLSKKEGLESPEAVWRERIRAKKYAREQRKSDGFGVPWGENGANE